MLMVLDVDAIPGLADYPCVPEGMQNYHFRHWLPLVKRPPSVESGRLGLVEGSRLTRIRTRRKKRRRYIEPRGFAASGS